MKTKARTKSIKREIVELSEADYEWAQCAVCHLRVACPAVWLGKLVRFRVPTVCVCINCLRAAVELLERPRTKVADLPWLAARRPSARGTYARLWSCPCGAKLFAEPKSARARTCPNCNRNDWRPLS